MFEKSKVGLFSRAHKSAFQPLLFQTTKMAAPTDRVTYLPQRGVGSGTSSGATPSAIPLHTMARTYLPRDSVIMPTWPSSEESMGTIPGDTRPTRRYLPPRVEAVPSWGTWGTAKRPRRMHQQRFARGEFEEDLHWAHSAATESSYEVRWDPTEARRANVIRRMERRIPTMAAPSVGSCDEGETSDLELREITSEQFRARVDRRQSTSASPRTQQRGVVPVRTVPSVPEVSEEASEGETSSEEYVPTRPD